MGLNACGVPRVASVFQNLIIRTGRFEWWVSYIGTVMIVKVYLRHIAEWHGDATRWLYCATSPVLKAVPCFADEILHCTSQGRLLRFEHGAFAPVPCISEKYFMSLSFVTMQLLCYFNICLSVPNLWLWLWLTGRRMLGITLMLIRLGTTASVTSGLMEGCLGIGTYKIGTEDCVDHVLSNAVGSLRESSY